MSYKSSSRFDIGTSQTIGKRLYMEDTVMVRGQLFDNIDYIAIFDGHNGREAAVKSMEMMHKFLNESLIKTPLCERHLKDVYQQVHDVVCAQTESGTTASVLIIRDNDIVVTHCGDSPVYVLENNKLRKIGVDHTVDCPSEVEMIEKQGGTIVDVKGIKRINSKIQVTRSIGDRSLHPPLSCVPDVEFVPLENVTSVIVASDGISTVPETVMSELFTQALTPEQQAQFIRNYAFEKDSKDNISVVVVKIR